MTTHFQSAAPDLITLDSDHVLDHAGGDPELLIQLCRAFLDELPLRMEQLDGAIAARDHHRAGRALLRLQNCILVFGSGHAAFTAESLEIALRSQRRRQVQRQWARLEAQLLHLVPQVQRLLLETALPGAAVQ